MGITSVLSGGYSVQWGKFLISACLAIKKDEKIPIFLYNETKFYSEVSKIQADFMPFKSWTDVLQVQPCFEIIDYFIFGILYLSFKFNCRCDCT